MKILLGLAFLLLGGAAPVAAVSFTLPHIHGLAYSSDGKKLYLPVHVGLAVYSNGRWNQAPGPTHDYMGFSATRDAFYSSGHPAPGSLLRNPLGLIKSRDQGKTWHALGLAGESDFHLMSASYETDAVYVFNSVSNSRMVQPGIYSTKDDGQTWQAHQGAGLAGEPISLAVHPSRPQLVAVGTSSGLYFSEDGGERFQPLLQGKQVTSVHFQLDGRALWFGAYDGQPRLARLDLKSGKAESVALPFSGRDAVAYIAENPVNPKEWAIATFQRSVYFSPDRGTTWKPIAIAGEAR